MGWLKTYITFRIKILIHRLPIPQKKAKNIIKIKCS